MAFVTVPDGSALCVTADGSQLRTDDNGTDCLCTGVPGGCEHVLAFSRCGTIQCPPPGVDIPGTVYVCSTATVETPDGRSNIQEVLDAGGTVTVQYSSGPVLVCYAFSGEVPRGTPLTLGAVAKFGSLCGTPECNPDLCERFWRVRPCGGLNDGVSYYVLASAVDGNPGGSFRIEFPPGSGRTRCFCLRPDAPSVRTDGLPPGAVILPTPTVFFENCCECGTANGDCQQTTFQEWIGYSGDGSGVYRDVQCCCSDDILRVIASGSIRTRQSSLDDPSQSTEQVIIINGAVRCSNGSWYLAGIAQSFTNDVLTDTVPFGCPESFPLNFLLSTGCGAYLRASEGDYRAPGGGPPADQTGSRLISGNCNGRQEQWNTVNLEGQAQGSRTLAISVGNFSVAVLYNPDNACTDDCHKTSTGVPNQTTGGNQGLRAPPQGVTDPAWEAMQGRGPFGCRGCGG